jgi:hypothetical protein
MFIPRKDTMYSCSKHNYTGLNNPCPDCKKEEKEFAWEWFKKDLVLNGEDNEVVIKYKQLFERRWKEWKEQKNVNTRSYKVRETI